MARVDAAIARRGGGAKGTWVWNLPPSIVFIEFLPQ